MVIISDPKELSIPTIPFDFNNPPVDPVALAEKLAKVMKENLGLGLAANQIGIGLSVFAMNSHPEVFVCFNPKIVHLSEEQILLEEGCLSFKNLIVPIKRSKEIRVRFQTPNGETLTKTFNGMSARVFQHEISHLEGKLFYNEANKYHRDKAFRNKIKLDKGNKNI